MKKYKWFPYLVLLVLAIVTIALKRCNNAPTPAPPTAQTQSTQGFDRNTDLYFTKHAKCRMTCRHITQSEVYTILQTGNINYKKSEIGNAPDPKYALEGYTNDKQHVRIIFAPKQKHTTVVTVIDLDNEWECPSCD